VFNLGSPSVVYKSLQSPLKYQTRCISCFPDKTGYLLGSIEGRVAVHHVEDNMQAKNFTFKCHRCGAAGAGAGAADGSAAARVV
jgi:mRNA export factor